MSRCRGKWTFLGVVFVGLASMGVEAQDLLISGFFSDSVALHAGGDGTYIRDFASIQGPQAMRFGPDGHLYVAEENRNRIKRYDGTTGIFLGDFVRDRPGTPEDETGGLAGPTGFDFGPDGNLYVASFNNDAVIRYDGTTGEFIDVFVTSGRGGLNGPDVGMIFGPDGNLYVPSFFGDRIPRYDGSTGVFLGDFVTLRSGGLARPRTLIFHTDGLLYVTGETVNHVLRYDGTTGAFVDLFVESGEGGLFGPTGMAFGPDGNLYVASVTREAVVYYDGTTGEPFGDFVRGRATGLDAPTFILFAPPFRMNLDPPEPGVAGQPNDLVVRDATPDSPVHFAFGLVSGETQISPCAGLSLSIGDPRLGGRIRSDETGVARLQRGVPARLSGMTLYIQAFERETCRVSSRVEYTFP